MFKGYINSTLEQLIKKNNVPMNSTTIKTTIEREEEGKKKGRREQRT